jgi:anti-sigma factor RsiW
MTPLYLTYGPEPGTTTMKNRPLACRVTTDRLTDYLEGALDVESRHSLEEHLESCPECSTTFKELRATISLLGRLKSPHTDPTSDMD